MSYNDKKNLAYNTEKRRKIKEIKSNELNKECFDCGSCYPEYISINNGIFICKDCLKIHNNFPKHISNTLKNNLSSLNSKELEYMYIGGNQKLLEFINYEYPQLQRYKISILYQTKAMQYYRNNLYYLINGGIKPIKPSEKINAYELVNMNEVESKKENINIIKKLNNNTYKKTKRNKSETLLETVNKKIREKNKTYKSKSKQKKMQNSLLDSDEDTLKRYKSFYKEMNKIFGTNIDLTNDEKKNIKNIGKKINKESKIISDNYKGKSKLSNNNENIMPNSNKDNNKNKNNNNSSKKINNKENPIEHIYNNNFITFSATKNIFMFTPNKDSIIYKHRKINNDNQSNNNKNNRNIPILNMVKEIYSKPKIPYLITSNKKRENNSNLYFSLQENNFKYDNLDLSDKNENEITLNGDKYIKNNNEISQEHKHTTKNIKNENKEMSEDINLNINIDLSKESFSGNQNNKYLHENKNIINNKDNAGEKGTNSIFAKKRISKLMKKDKQSLENKNNLIFKDNLIDKKENSLTLFRNEKDENNLNKDNQNNNNNAELKKNKMDEVNKILNKDINNEIDAEDNKNKALTEIKESDNKRMMNINLNFNNSNLEEKEDKKNPIMKKKEEEASPHSKKHSVLTEKYSKYRYNKRNDKKDEDKKLESESKKMEEKENLENKNYNDNKNNYRKFFADKRRKRCDKLIEMKENIKDENKEKKIEEEKKRKNKDEMNKNEKDNYKIKKVEKIKTIKDNNYSPFHRQKNELTNTSIGQSELRREDKNNKINNSENFCSVFEKNLVISKTTNDSNENNGTKKFSIRNKYKMRKMKELI